MLFQRSFCDTNTLKLAPFRSDPNGASLRIRGTIFTPVRDLSHYMSGCSQKLIRFGSSLKTSWFASPWALPDR